MQEFCSTSGHIHRHRFLSRCPIGGGVHIRQCHQLSIQPKRAYLRVNVSQYAAVQPRQLLGSCHAAARGAQDWNPVELVKREAGLQSNRLHSSVRERVISSIERLRYRVTVGDVAATAGVRVVQADEALKALAYDTLAALEVSPEGDVVYAFPRDFRSTLRSKSVLARVQPVLQKLQTGGAYAVKVAFGTALIASMAIAWLGVAAAIVAGSGASSSSSSSSGNGDRKGRKRDKSRSTSYNYNYHYHSYNSGPRLLLDITELLLRLHGSRSRAAKQDSRDPQASQPDGLSFPEAVFSCVFGDGDPNEGFDEARWKALAALIQAKGGVVTAEEMAPFLDPPEPAPGSGTFNGNRSDTFGGWGSDGLGDEQLLHRATAKVPYPDESFVLPALIRFGGEPIVDGKGRLMYAFPNLQRTAVARDVVWSRPAAVEPAAEADWKLTSATSGQITAAVALGLVNVLGVALLADMAAQAHVRRMLAAQGLRWVLALLPALKLYAVTFFAAPAVRAVLNARRNAAIQARNAARSAAAKLLNAALGAAASPKAAAPAAGPALKEVKEKVAAARRAGEAAGGVRTLRASDAVFRSDKELSEQESELDEWDRRMDAASSKRPGGSSGGGGSAGSGGRW